MENSIQESRYAHKLRRCELYKTHILQKMHKECDNYNSHSKNGIEQKRVLTKTDTTRR